MSFDALKNGAYGTVAVGGAPSPAISGGSLTLLSGDGARFPDPATEGPFEVVLCPPGITVPIFTTGSTAANAEIGRCTARAGDVLTVTRAVEGSTAQAVADGWQVVGAITKKTLTDIQAIARYTRLFAHATYR